MMKWFNTNSIHNLLNLLGWVMGLITSILIATGCTTLPGGNLECSASFLPPVYMVPIMAAIFAVKQIMNMVRDGLSGLVKQQPPVVSIIPTGIVKVVKGTR